MGFLVLLIINLIKFIKTRRKQEFVYNPSRSRLPESWPRATGFGEFIQDAKNGKNTKSYQATFPSPIWNLKNLVPKYQPYQGLILAIM
jgi:hypothetical protein